MRWGSLDQAATCRISEPYTEALDSTSRTGVRRAHAADSPAWLIIALGLAVSTCAALLSLHFGRSATCHSISRLSLTVGIASSRANFPSGISWRRAALCQVSYKQDFSRSLERVGLHIAFMRLSSMGSLLSSSSASSDSWEEAL